MPEHLEPAASYPELVGRLLAERRKELGLSQAELAQAVGMHQSGWSKVERGLSGLSVEQLAVAADFLQTRPGILLGNADKAADFARARGVRVEWTRPSDDALAVGLAFVGAAAVAALIAAALASNQAKRHGK